MYVMKGALLLGVASLIVAYAAADGLNFGYSGSNGPDQWGSLSPDYKQCSDGKQQSPIDIAKDQISSNQELKSLERSYTYGNAYLINKGYNIALKFGQDVGPIIIDGKNYTLVQMHWHTPSEHTINGKRFAVELQLIHMSKDGNFAVVGILYRIGVADPFLMQIKDEIDQLTKETCGGDQETQIPIKKLRMRPLKRQTRKYYRYAGSLTAPPCSENVSWTILGKIREVTQEQADALMAPLDSAYRNNSRPAQPMNGRRVQLYEEPDEEEVWS